MIERSVVKVLRRCHFEMAEAVIHITVVASVGDVVDPAPANSPPWRIRPINSGTRRRSDEHRSWDRPLLTHLGHQVLNAGGRSARTRHRSIERPFALDEVQFCGGPLAVSYWFFAGAPG